ncbi:MAG: hypothetical protein EZS28_045047, partial [Streblomastix strix]
RNKEQGELTDQEQNSFVNWSENNKNIGDDEDDDEEDQLQIQGQATDEMLEIIAPMNPVLWQKLLPHMNIDWDHIKHYGKDKSKSQIQLQKKEELPIDDFRQSFTEYTDVVGHATVFQTSGIGVSELIGITEIIVNYVQRQYGSNLQQIVCNFIKDANHAVLNSQWMIIYTNSQ